MYLCVIFADVKSQAEGLQDSKDNVENKLESDGSAIVVNDDAKVGYLHLRT